MQNDTLVAVDIAKEVFEVGVSDRPGHVVPHGSDWPGITDDVGTWLRAEHSSFPSERSQRRCPCPHHPSGELMVQVAKVPLGDPARSFLIIHRYGEMRIGESVEKALREKLPKLVQTPADRRLLLLERDQGWVLAAEIRAAVEARRKDFPELAAVDEIWIADTASFENKGRYVAFSGPGAKGMDEWRFEFYDGSPLATYKNGMPVPAGGPGG